MSADPISAWWRQDVDRLIADLEDDLHHAERQRYGGLDLGTLTLEEVGAALYVSDKLREEGILEVTPEKMRELIDAALEAGLGYGRGTHE